MGQPVEVTVLDQDFLLLSERALFWRQKKLLVAADPHFGKAQVFRESGIPLPAGTTETDLQRMSNLVNRLKPARLLILGDLIHGRIEHPHGLNRSIGRWRRRHRSLKLILVTGNHDLWAGDPPAPFHFDHVTKELTAGPFVFRHQPDPLHSGFGISGHLHPAVALRGKGRQREVLPCFCFDDRSALLPAFGSFTGHREIRPLPGQRVYAVAGDEIIEIPRAAGGRPGRRSGG